MSTFLRLSHLRPPHCRCALVCAALLTILGTALAHRAVHVRAHARGRRGDRMSRASRSAGARRVRDEPLLPAHVELLPDRYADDIQPTSTACGQRAADAPVHQLPAAQTSTLVTHPRRHPGRCSTRCTTSRVIAGDATSWLQAEERRRSGREQAHRAPRRNLKIGRSPARRQCGPRGGRHHGVLGRRPRQRGLHADRANCSLRASSRGSRRSSSCA